MNKFSRENRILALVGFGVALILIFGLIFVQPSNYRPVAIPTERDLSPAVLARIKKRNAASRTTPPTKALNASTTDEPAWKRNPWNKAHPDFEPVSGPQKKAEITPSVRVMRDGIIVFNNDTFDWPSVRLMLDKYGGFEFPGGSVKAGGLIGAKYSDFINGDGLRFDFRTRKASTVFVHVPGYDAPGFQIP